MAIPDGVNAAFGATFAPTRESAELGPNRARTEGLQEAIRVLSLHVPQVLGGRPVAAGELLRASGGGDEVSAVVESVLRSIMGGGKMPMMPTPGGPLLPPPGTPPSRAPFIPPGTAAGGPGGLMDIVRAIQTIMQGGGGGAIPAPKIRVEQPIPGLGGMLPT